jgi:hypothetical protein
MFKPIAPFSEDALPQKLIDEFVEKVNKLINQYNASNDPREQIKILEAIQQLIKKIDHFYPDSCLEKAHAYREKHNLLFQEIKYQYNKLGIPLVPLNNSFPLSECIGTMSPRKVNTLISFLVSNSNSHKISHKKLHKVYSKKDYSAEAKAFRLFLKNHEISFLGGSNCKNFKITNLIDNSVYVLKIDNRLDMPKYVEDYLRTHLKETFTPIYTERQATYKDKFSTKTRTLLVTDYCPEGSLYTHCRNNRNPNISAQNANIIFTQMANILLSIEKAGCMFPDSKLTNWLIDNYQLKIADTKSFVFINKAGQYEKEAPKNKHMTLLRTSNFTPPEYNLPVFNAQPVHAFILGKNIYTYLTGRVPQGIDGAKFSFSSCFFKTALGEQYKTLIQALVKPEPDKRISLEDALKQLVQLTSLSELEALKFGAHDRKMEQFIADNIKLLKISTPQKSVLILEELKFTINALKADKASAEIRTIIQNFREGNTLFSIGMKRKALRIERSICNASIEERGKLLESESGKEVMKALASHRHFGKRGVTFFTETGKIDPKKAARAFKEFNNKFSLS